MEKTINDTMTTKLKISQLAMAAVLLAGALAAQAQTNVTTITKTTTITTVTTNNTTITNTAITVTTNTVQPKITAPTNVWKSSVALGVTVARGNTDSTQASISGSTQKKWLQNSLIFGADGLYGETKPPGSPKETESAETAHGFSQYDRSFWDGFYGYARIDG